jgi:hypothetical protein
MPFLFLSRMMQNGSDIKCAIRKFTTNEILLFIGIFTTNESERLIYEIQNELTITMIYTSKHRHCL